MFRKSDQVRIESVQCLSPDGLHRMAYKDWGEVDNPNVLICVHGLTRVSDDFDTLAREMSRQFRVICPDVVGRGRSGWLKNPQNYQVQQYVADMVTLIARIQPDQPADIGPALNVSALTRIGQYISQPMRYSTFDEAASFIRAISQTFGEQTEDEWHKFCKDVLRQDKDGMWIRHYDLNLAMSMQAITPDLAQAMQVMMWAAYDAITCPTLLLRGADSDLLLHDTALQMTTHGPKAKLIEFEKVGHAPTLVHEDQIAPIREFLFT
jgi:pimeloyl-ACP methyl ester carboxylesterase